MWIDHYPFTDIKRHRCDRRFIWILFQFEISMWLHLSKYLFNKRDICSLPQHWMRFVLFALLNGTFCMKIKTVGTRKCMKYTRLDFQKINISIETTEVKNGSVFLWWCIQIVEETNFRSQFDTNIFCYQKISQWTNLYFEYLKSTKSIENGQNQPFQILSPYAIKEHIGSNTFKYHLKSICLHSRREKTTMVTSHRKVWIISGITFF